MAAWTPLNHHLMPSEGNKLALKGTSPAAAQARGRGAGKWLRARASNGCEKSNHLVHCHLGTGLLPWHVRRIKGHARSGGMKKRVSYRR